MSATPMLQVIGLKKSFGSKQVHLGIDFELHQGECLTLLGDSGSGKSLILRSIIGLEDPDAGSILFHGKSASEQGDWINVRKRIGYVFQNGALFDSLTVKENLAYPLRAHTRMDDEQIDRKIQEMLDLIGMPRAGGLLPGELSGGMQKRAGLARAMILGPEILLLDEPTAGLDPQNTRRFIDNILTLKKSGVTFLFVTHDIPAALALADRIAVLESGKIHCILGPEEFTHSNDPVVERFNLRHT